MAECVPQGLSNGCGRYKRPGLLLPLPLLQSRVALACAGLLVITCCSRASWPRYRPSNAGLTGIASNGSLCLLPLDRRLEPQPSVCFHPLIGTNPTPPCLLGPPLIIVAPHRRQIRMDQRHTSNEMHYRP